MRWPGRGFSGFAERHRGQWAGTGTGARSVVMDQVGRRGGGVEHGEGCGRDSGAGGPAREGAAAVRASGRAARCGRGQAQPVGAAGPLGVRAG